MTQRERAEALLIRSVSTYGENAVTVDATQHKCFMLGDGEKRCCLSQMTATVSPLGQTGCSFSLHVADNQSTPILLNVDSLAKMGAIVNFAAGTAIFSSGDPDSTFALYKSQGGHYWLDLFQDHDRVGDRMAIFDT